MVGGLGTSPCGLSGQGVISPDVNMVARCQVKCNAPLLHGASITTYDSLGYEARAGFSTCYSSVCPEVLGIGLCVFTITPLALCLLAADVRCLATHTGGFSRRMQNNLTSFCGACQSKSDAPTFTQCGLNHTRSRLAFSRPRPSPCEP